MNLKQPLVNGDLVLVPCVIRSEYDKLYITPVYDHPHNDVENGQPETHYHADYRFIRRENKHSSHIWGQDIRPVVPRDGVIEYYYLPVVNSESKTNTPVTLIKNSKLKYKCIHKGKCPHRGFDLSQAQPKDGVITCPLHGLKFDGETKELVQ